MSLDEALSAFSEVLMGGEPDTAADQLDMLSALVAQLRESQGQLHDTRGQLRESRGQFHRSQGKLRESQDQLHQSEGQLRESQEQRRQSQHDADAKGEEIKQLHHALESRDIIGQAKGMLMERFNVDAAAAFQLLVNLSQNSNIRVEVIAQKLVEIDHPRPKGHDLQTKLYDDGGTTNGTGAILRSNLSQLAGIANDRHIIPGAKTSLTRHCPYRSTGRCRTPRCRERSSLSRVRDI